MTDMRTLFLAGPGIECRTDLIGPPPLIGRGTPPLVPRLQSGGTDCIVRAVCSAGAR